jgi:putative transcriptional regulator
VHHPLPEHLFDYATGSLAEEPAVAIASHNSLCVSCRREVARLEALGGVLTMTIEPECEVSEDLLPRTLMRLNNPPEPAAAASLELDERTRRLVPIPVWPYLRGSLDQLVWRPLGLGLSVAALKQSSAGYRLSLLRIAAGRRVPRHTHRGEELTVVLAGGFSDETGHYKRGDYAFAGQDCTHRPIADHCEDCICLVVLDKPTRMTSILGRMIEPFFRL